MMWIPFFLILNLAGEVVGHIESDPVGSIDECAQTLTQDRPSVEKFVQSHLGSGYKLGAGDCQGPEEKGIDL